MCVCEGNGLGANVRCARYKITSAHVQTQTHRCGNHLHQQIIVIYTPTGATMPYPPEEVVEEALRVLREESMGEGDGGAP